MNGFAVEPKDGKFPNVFRFDGDPMVQIHWNDIDLTNNYNYVYIL